MPNPPRLPPSAASDRFNPNIHGARGAFALSVFVFHIFNSGLRTFQIPFGDWAYEAGMSLAFGVDLFFVISGIVILGAFRRARSLPGFLWDRVTRIFPVLWVCVLVVFLLLTFGGRPVGSGGFDTFAILLANLFALPPIVRVPLIHPAAWSLSYEFAFYLLFVVFGLLASFAPKRIALAMVFVLAIAVFWHHVRATYFLVGLLIGAGFMTRGMFGPLIRFPAFWLVAFLAAWQILAILVGGSIHAAIWSRLAVEPVLLGLFLVAVAAASFAMAGIHEGLGWFSILLRRPVMQWLGTISFSLYLWQTPILAVTKRALDMAGLLTASGNFAQLVMFAIGLPLTLVVSHASQRVLEVTATKWLRRRFLRDKGDRSRHLTPTAALAQASPREKL